MAKGMSNMFDSAAWSARSMGWHNWGSNGSNNGPKPPASGGTTGVSAGGATATLTVTFESEEAGYANTMGWYNARTGEAGILFKNLNDDGKHAAVHAGDTSNLTVLQSDLDANKIGFFLIPNGANKLSSTLLSSAMRFEVGSNGDGRIVIDRNYGHDVVLNGNEVLFSNQTHNKGDFDYVSGTVGTKGQTKAQKFAAQSDGPDGILGTMAWDDQAVRINNSCTDRDFNDVVFTVTKQGSTPPTNSAPTDINLSGASIDENVAGGAIGTLSTVDPNQGDTHIYTVSDGRFEVVSGQLKLKDGVSLNHEAEGSVAVTVTTTDQGGLSYSEGFTITVKDVNEAPTDIGLSKLTVDENEFGALIGTLSTIDDDAGDSHVYSVDDDRFEVIGDQLWLKEESTLNHEAEPTVIVNVTSTDLQGNSVTKALSINVQDMNEAPSGPVDIDPSADLVASVAPVGIAVGITASSFDPDDGDSVTYSLSNDAGGLFAIDAATGVVTVADSLEGTGTEHTITVRATDGSGEYSETDFTIEVGEVFGSMSFGTLGIDTFLFDLGQEAATTLVGFNRASDMLSFSGVSDANANGVDLADLLSMVAGVTDFGQGSDVVVDFTTGASLIFQGAGTPGGTTHSLTGLVASPATQLQIA